MEVDTPVDALVGEINLQISETGDAAHLRVDHPRDKATGDRCVDGVTSCAQYRRACFDRFGLSGDHHAAVISRHDGPLRSSFSIDGQPWLRAPLAGRTPSSTFPEGILQRTAVTIFLHLRRAFRHN